MLKSTDLVSMLSVMVTSHAFALDTTMTLIGTKWAVNDLSISTITPYVIGGNQAVLVVEFNKAANPGANLLNVNNTNTYVKNYMLINGKTISSICNSGALDTQVWINYVSGKMEIWIKDTCTEQLKLDGTDTIVFSSGFITPTAHSFSSNNTLTFNGTTWLKNYVVNDLSVSTITPYTVAGNQAVLEVEFNNAAGGNLINTQNTDNYVKNYIMINGKTINTICNSGALDTQVWVNYVSGKMQIWIKDTCTEQLKLDGTDTITFMSGFVIPSGHSFSSSVSYKYINYSQKWVISNFIAFGTYNVSANNVITNIQHGQTLATFKNSLSPANGVSVLFTNDQTTGAIVGTGTIVDITVYGEALHYTIAIFGDVDGNGNINPTDLIKIKQHLLKTAELTGAYKTAGDISSKGIISISDLLKVKKHILGISLIS